MRIYADNAATTKISDVALDAMMPCFREFYGNPSSLHSVGQDAFHKVRDARNTVAECINADPNDVYFSSGGSESDNWAIKGTAYLMAKKGKKHIISSKFEHHAKACQYNRPHINSIHLFSLRFYIH